MGVFQSSVHFDTLTSVIDNHSPYEIMFRVERPNLDQKAIQHQDEKLLSNWLPVNAEHSNFVYTGSVQPYSTKYYDFKDIETEYKFSVYAIKLDPQRKETEVQLENNLKILSENTVCIKVTSDLKVIHLNNEEIEVLKLRKEVELIFLKQSKIIQSQDMSHRLLGFFNEYPFKVKLLFRASDHNFDMKQFYSKFGLIESALLICKTNADKVIGGYSRQSFIHPQNGNVDGNSWRCIKDKTNESFIFSLNTNDVFRLKSGQNALFYNKNQQQICFGSDELRINDHSDRNPCLSQNFNTNYENHNYNNDPESYKLFNGNESAEFTTKEWEVWAVDFEEEQDEEQDAPLLALSMDL